MKLDERLDEIRDTVRGVCHGAPVHLRPVDGQVRVKVTDTDIPNDRQSRLKDGHGWPGRRQSRKQRQCRFTVPLDIGQAELEEVALEHWTEQ